jgi:hypothetical protein
MQQTLSWLLLLGGLVVLLFLGTGSSIAQPAVAAIAQLEESPGQMLYQSRQTLRDRDGKTWQAIAFKRVRNGNTEFYLRLVGFPGIVVIDRSQPLTLTTSLGQIFTATDVSEQFLSDSSTAANVGQYDLQPILPQLKPEIPLKLTLQTVSGSTVTLNVPPLAVQEWHTVAVRSS